MLTSAAENKSQVIQPSSDNFFKYDGPAGTVVFLVALPLCLGIALASGAPLFSGVIAGIVGGIVVGFFSGSQVSVSGPAAGLSVIVATAIQSLGDFRALLLAVVLAGVIQIAFGILRFGAIADYVPHSAIRGMLAAIGIVIIFKQIPHALGRDKDYVGDLGFLGQGGSNTLTDLAAAVITAHPGAMTISGLCLALLISWEKLSPRLPGSLRLIPGPLLAVALGVGLNQSFGLLAPSLKIFEPEHMVALPVMQSIQEVSRQITLPDFSRISDPHIWTAALTIAVVASIESLLSVEAADKLDPYKRISPPNQELRAQGLGNLISGMLGGLPVTSVVVRTSANVYAGARTWRAAVIHGVLLLAAVLFIPSLLNLTPLACLAAVLLAVGYKLTKPALYREMFASGWSQFLPFLITLVAIVFTDLLKGVIVGLFTGVFFVIRNNHHQAITVVHQGRHYLLRFNKDASFVNKNELRTHLRKIPEGSHLFIDGTRALYIDYDIREVVEDFKKLAPYRGISLEFTNF
ncbi:MAG: SulP family inorganic anion transporter [Acidobacteria bacterium]|nr:SulP family inorganic anion transporter [Acidobacteriota bacterium]